MDRRNPGLAGAGTLERPRAPESGAPEGAIFCRLGALSPAERERQALLRRRVEAAVREAQERPDGYALLLDPAPELFVAAAEWITLERRCCPFMRLALERGDETWLVLEGGEGVKEFLTAELAPLLR